MSQPADCSRQSLATCSFTPFFLDLKTFSAFIFQIFIPLALNLPLNQYSYLVIAALTIYTYLINARTFKACKNYYIKHTSEDVRRRASLPISAMFGGLPTALDFRRQLGYGTESRKFLQQVERVKKVWANVSMALWSGVAFKVLWMAAHGTLASEPPVAWMWEVLAVLGLLALLREAGSEGRVGRGTERSAR